MIEKRIVPAIRPTTRRIFVTFQKEGLHRYPAASEDPRLADVAFLANEHRHMFHFRVMIDVEHDDRDIEFLQFKRHCESLYQEGNGTLQLNHKSCEMMAEDLAQELVKKYPHRRMTIEVSEDGENGAVIDFEPRMEPVYG